MIIINKNERVIDFDNKFTFTFLDDIGIDARSPVSDYYLKLDDLSINLLISLKWIIWGYVFFDSISKELSKNKNELMFEDIIGKSIHKFKNLTFLNDQKHELIIDDEIVESKEKFENLLENFYNADIFDENTKVHIKLKINLREFLAISHFLFPALLEFK